MLHNYRSVAAVGVLAFAILLGGQSALRQLQPSGTHYGVSSPPELNGCVRRDRFTSTWQPVISGADVTVAESYGCGEYDVH